MSVSTVIPDPWTLGTAESQQVLRGGGGGVRRGTSDKVMPSKARVQTDFTHRRHQCGTEERTSDGRDNGLVVLVKGE